MGGGRWSRHVGVGGGEGIAVTAGISLTKEDISAVYWCERGGGLLSLVNTCGEIDVCTPCTEATPSAEGEYPLWVGSGGPPAKGGWWPSVSGE